jgi:phospholipase/carboxylesterase
MTGLSGPVFPPISGRAPSNAIILLHGLGADGENLIGLADYMSKDFPDTLFIAPNAPFRFDMFDSGYQWFSLADRDPVKMLDGVSTAMPILNDFIDEVLEEYDLTFENLALIGFSQGTMTALHTAIRREDAIAGVVGFSGALIAPELLDEALSKPDVCLIHGTADDVVPFDAMNQAAAALEAAGFNVETHARRNLPHSIDVEGIEIAIKFLKSRLQ